jgi:hypothetical protein
VTTVPSLGSKHSFIKEKNAPELHICHISTYTPTCSTTVSVPVYGVHMIFPRITKIKKDKKL